MKKKYYVSIEHAMRVINKVGGLELLEGVVDVGFKIEKAKQGWKKNINYILFYCGYSF